MSTFIRRAPSVQMIALRETYARSLNGITSIGLPHSHPNVGHAQCSERIGVYGDFVPCGFICPDTQ